MLCEPNRLKRRGKEEQRKFNGDLLNGVAPLPREYAGERGAPFALAYYFMRKVFSLSLANEMLFDKHNRGVELKIGVVLFAEAVAFVAGHQVPDRAATGFDFRHHLLSFA